DVVLIAATGYFVLEHTGHPNAAAAWLLGFAAGHILLGAIALRQPINSEIGSLLVAVGMGLSALGFADALHGPVLVVGCAMQAVVLAYVATGGSGGRGPLGPSAGPLLGGAGLSLNLPLAHVLLFEAPPAALIAGVEDLGQALVGLGACAAAALYGRFALRK